MLLPGAPMTGTFVGDPLEPAPLLKVMNGTPGADIVFIDRISFTGPAQAVPQNGVLVLLLSGAALMSLMRWAGSPPKRLSARLKVDCCAQGAWPTGARVWQLMSRVGPRGAADAACAGGC